jgi:hypothetical protein
MTELTETLVVTFFETPVLAARVRDGTILLSIRDLCDAVGLRRYSQVVALTRTQTYVMACRLFGL